MKIRKKQIMEIIDSGGNLIGNKDVPTSGADLDSQANHTSDYNAKISAQPYRYDMLGRFGFSLLPFMEEGKETADQTEFLNDVAKLMYEKYMETLEYYYRNPNKLKPDFRMQSEKDFNSQPEERKKMDFQWARKLIKIVEKHFDESFKDQKKIDESKVAEDKMIDKKSETEISKKAADNTINDKKISQIAGLINKLDKKDINKLKNLLEDN
jgi:hypothetical protein